MVQELFAGTCSPLGGIIHSMQFPVLSADLFELHLDQTNRIGTPELERFLLLRVIQSVAFPSSLLDRAPLGSRLFLESDEQLSQFSFLTELGQVLIASIQPYQD